MTGILRGLSRCVQKSPVLSRYPTSVPSRRLLGLTIPRSQSGYRSFLTSRPAFQIGHLDSTSSSTSASTITSASASTSVPPKPRLRLHLLRFVPWKTIFFLVVFGYGAWSIEKWVRKSVLAILGAFSIPENTWLYLNLNDLHVTDSPHADRALQMLPFVPGRGKRRMTTLDITNTIYGAAEDPNVKGLILAFNQSTIEHVAIGGAVESHLGLATIQEISSAIRNFSNRKKEQRGFRRQGSKYVGSSDGNQDIGAVIAIADNYGSSEYILASTADSIVLQPTGSIHLTGLSIHQLFFGRLLEKYGIDWKVEARRDYKSALAAFSGSGWNEKTRQNLEDLMWSLQGSILTDLSRVILSQASGITLVTEPLLELASSIGEQQKLALDKLTAFTDLVQAGPFNYTEAVARKLVEGSAYPQDLLAAISDRDKSIWSLRKYMDASTVVRVLGGLNFHKWILPQLWKKSHGQDQIDEEEGSSKRIMETKRGQPASLAPSLKFRLTQNHKPSSFDEIGVNIEIEVPRVIGIVHIDNTIESSGRLGGEAIAAHIMKAVVQRRIHGLVLRINSPGGDAVASDTIWNAASFAKGAMPVVASLGDVAASGGYYVASAANHIYTNPATITGSIGVIAGWPVIKRLLEQVEVNSDSIQSMPNAAWNHMMIGLPETEEAKLKTHIDHMYNTFKTVVATGRNMSMDDVERVAQGQVYTGCQAVKLGLADGLGGTTEAIMLAGVFSLHRDAIVSGNEDAYAYWAGKVKNKDLFESALKGGQEAVEVIRDLINLSPELSHLTAPDDTQIRDLLLKRANISLVPAIAGEVIPRVNPANETFGAMIEHAFQSDDERSPIPVDELSSPSDGTASQLILPALLGIALSNNIPLWQFPMFCYWYASQASGKISTGIFDGWLNRLFAKLAPEANWKPGNTFPKAQKGLDIRMELPPIEIFY